MGTSYLSLLNTVQWLFNFKQFHWFGGHQLSAHILVRLYMENAWLRGCHVTFDSTETEVIF